MSENRSKKRHLYAPFSHFMGTRCVSALFSQNAQSYPAAIYELRFAETSPQFGIERHFASAILLLVGVFLLVTNST